MPNSKKRLTPKQQRFIEEYLIDLNATQASARAGYQARNENSYAAIGKENLRKPQIKKAIQEAQKRRSERAEITQDMVLRELASLAFSNLKDFVQWGKNGVRIKGSSELAPEQARCISEISEVSKKGGRTLVKFKLHNKEKALELIGRHLGMFNDKLRLGGDKDAPPIRHQQSYTNFPPEPRTLAEWENQVSEARKRRLERKREEEGESG